MPDKFRILFQGGEAHFALKSHPEWPRFVPWEFIAPHNDQALHNHDQTLDRLNQRGGLAPEEMLAVIDGVDWATYADIGTVEAMRRLIAKLEEAGR